jgi:hypothetical protein
MSSGRRGAKGVQEDLRAGQAEEVAKFAVPVPPLPDGFLKTNQSNEAHSWHTSRRWRKNLPSILEEMSLIEQISVAGANQ